ncbi:unnamed protein product [Brassica rapa subsp. trilocularis]
MESLLHATSSLRKRKARNTTATVSPRDLTKPPARFLNPFFSNRF